MKVRDFLCHSLQDIFSCFRKQTNISYIILMHCEHTGLHFILPVIYPVKKEFISQLNKQFSSKTTSLIIKHNVCRSESIWSNITDGTGLISGQDQPRIIYIYCISYWGLSWNWFCFFPKFSILEILDSALMVKLNCNYNQKGCLIS